MRAAEIDDLGLFEALIPAVVAAGDAILAIRAEGNKVETKADKSPVTAADRAAEAIILEALHVFAPHLRIVAEEEVSAGRIPDVGPTYLLVDALDGTRDFLAGGDDFTVNIGLVRNGAAAAGIIGAPSLSKVWIGATGAGARRIEFGADGRTEAPIAVRVRPENGLDIVASRSHRTPETNAFIARFPGSRLVAAGSSLKLTMVAEGRADLYPRLAPTSQWDVAAGDAILAAAGGRVVDLEGRRLNYRPRPGQGPHPFLNPWFVATGGFDPFG
jgi:3'(2'),5'-bisphosphate nucleotidase